MASFDYRLNPLYAIKECSSCEALYTSDYCCSKGGLEDKILVPKTPDSSQRPPQDCVKCGNPVDGLNYQGCALWRKKLKEVWFTICHENGIYQDLLNTYESSDDDTNVVNAPREPFVMESFGYNCPPKAPIISNPEPCNQTIDELPQTLPSFDPTCYSEKENSLPYVSKPNFVDDSPNVFNPPPQPPIDDDSHYDEDIDYVDASPPDYELVSLEVVGNVTPEDGEIKDDVLREKLSKINLLIAMIEALKDNPPLSSSFVTNGSTTTRSDYSLPDYEAFYLDDDHIKEKSSGSTTTHADFSQYDSFIFDLSIDSFPPADRSDFYHEEFVDELAHIISPPEYDCFYFKSEPDPGELTSIVDSGIRENVLSTTNVNLPFEDDQSPLLAYVVWIFLPFLTYPVTPPYLLSCGNEDTIFDPGISVYHSFMPSVSHRSGTFMKFNDFSDCDDSRARGFVLRSLELHILSFIWEIQYPNLID
ncbi:hypothetical protein Tco_1300416 [Tanacetum coccineum]